MPVPRAEYDRLIAQLVQQRRNETMSRFVDELKRDVADETFYAPGFEPPQP